MSTSELPNPAPYISPEIKEFWDATADGRLLLRKCDDCGEYIWYPRPFCPSCGSTSTSWTEASGQGHGLHVHDRAPQRGTGVPGGAPVRYRLRSA